MDHCLSKRFPAFLESFETQCANLILVFLETSGSPMDPEPHDGTLAKHSLPGSTSRVSGSESNVDHDVRKPWILLVSSSSSGSIGSHSPFTKGSRSPLIPCNAGACFPSRSMERRLFSTGNHLKVLGFQGNRYAREDSNPQPKVP